MHNGEMLRGIEPGKERTLPMKSMLPEVGRITEGRCAGCGTRLNAVCTANGEAAMAAAGDLTVCTRCGALMRLDDDLRPRALTDAEAEELMADRDRMEEMARMVRILATLGAPPWRYRSRSWLRSRRSRRQKGGGPSMLQQ
jgi:hypothetical protein